MSLRFDLRRPNNFHINIFERNFSQHAITKLGLADQSNVQNARPYGNEIKNQNQSHYLIVKLLSD